MQSITNRNFLTRQLTTPFILIAIELNLQNSFRCIYYNRLYATERRSEKRAGENKQEIKEIKAVGRKTKTNPAPTISCNNSHKDIKNIKSKEARFWYI